jgi:hypothetical protein
MTRVDHASSFLLSLPRAVVVVEREAAFGRRAAASRRDESSRRRARTDARARSVGARRTREKLVARAGSSLRLVARVGTRPLVARRAS